MTVNYITINNFATYNLVCKNAALVLKHNIVCWFYPKYITFLSPSPMSVLPRVWVKLYNSHKYINIENNFQHFNMHSAIRFSTPDNIHVILSIEQYFYHAKLTELIASYLYSRLIYYYFFISGNINKPYRYSISKRIHH